MYGEHHQGPLSPIFVTFLPLQRTDGAMTLISGGCSLRCFFIKDGHIVAVEFLTSTDDSARVAEARRLFEKLGRQHGADGFEVWDRGRFVARFPDRQPGD